MNPEPTRREVLGHAVRGTGLLALGGGLACLVPKAGRHGVWVIDPTKCVNIRLGATGVDYCDKCATTCVVTLSAVRAVNEYSKCGRCCICPGYFEVTSEIGPAGLSSVRLEVRYDLCVNCNRCAIDHACPDDALTWEERA